MISGGKHSEHRLGIRERRDHEDPRIMGPKRKKLVNCVYNMVKNSDCIPLWSNYDIPYLYKNPFVMNTRSQNLMEIRPTISSIVITDSMGEEELFQNRTLRPIIKMQNPLLLLMFKNYIRKYKNGFYELGLEKRLDFIGNSIQKDVKFRNSLKGVVIGQFTEEEYGIYIQNSSPLNKRMMQMVIDRLKDQVQLFELEAEVSLSII